MGRSSSVKHLKIFGCNNSTQVKPFHKKHRVYSPTSLTNAYLRVKDGGIPVKRAAKLYGVPQSTLRDRILGKVDPENASYKEPLFTQLEEAKIVEHLKKMADYGYGYTRQECVDLASNYAVELGKRAKDKPLSIMWMRNFLKRWPEVRVLKPKGLEFVRARMTSEGIVNGYFTNLETCLRKYDLLDKPHLVFNMDEKGISVDHKPPYIVGRTAYCPQAVTSGKGNNITVLGCGSASGVAIPPYFVFPGKRMVDGLMDGATPGAMGTVTESGWSNGVVFRKYLETHFLKYIPGRNGEKVLLLLDGHRSHVSIGVIDWALENDIILFILPAHTSHLLQSMDVACYGPFERIYNAMCHKQMRETAETITRYNVCKIACQVYTKALCAENLMSAFRKTGIHPFDPQAISKAYIKPAEVFFTDNHDTDAQPEAHVEVADTETQLNAVEETGPVNPQLPRETEQQGNDLFETRERALIKIKQDGQLNKKRRNTMSKIVAGKEVTNDSVYEAMVQHEKAQKPTKKITQAKTQSKGSKKTKEKTTDWEQQPGPSHINLANDSSDDSDDNSDVNDDEKCCVCGLWTPIELAGRVSVMFTKWVQCDGIRNRVPCKHWTHLSYCTNLRVVRRGDKFFCIHCTAEE